MIAYYGRFGQYLGQAAPADVSVAPPPAPAPAPAPAPSAVSQDLAALDAKVTLTKGALIVGGVVLAGLTMTLSGALLRRA
jgi:hypothetical protein